MTVRRSQAIGAFPLPAGYLLIDDGDDVSVADVRAGLCLGRLPAHWPDALSGHELAYAGRVDEALSAFAGDSPVDRYNRFVLAPDGVDLDELKRALPRDIAPLVDVVAYSIGLTDEVPDADGLEGEVAAVALAAAASAELASGRAPDAVRLLLEAAERVGSSHPPLAGLLMGNAGGIALDHGLDQTAAMSALTTGIDLLSGTDLEVGCAELHYQLASALHAAASRGERPLTDAIDHYYSVLQLIDQVRAPHLWAAAQLNLGTAYLTMPMVEASDQLRAGIAMQSLRAALEVFTKEDNPAEWSSAQLNLANALVYTPSTHQGDNLVEAVERYEEVLELRDRQADPMGRARLLANQGNALAHLGIFDHAKAKLYEARFLFEEQGDHDSVMMVRSVLDEIARETVPQEVTS